MLQGNDDNTVWKVVKASEVAAGVGKMENQETWQNGLGLAGKTGGQMENKLSTDHGDSRFKEK